jgi:hypothetical protein
MGIINHKKKKKKGRRKGTKCSSRASTGIIQPILLSTGLDTQSSNKMAGPHEKETRQYNLTKGSEFGGLGIQTSVVAIVVENVTPPTRPYDIYALVAAIRERPRVFAWCLYACYCSMVVAFESVATGTSTSIPRFRKDFGHPFEGGYVLDHRWQSAFDAGPRVGSVIATLSQGPLADKFGRRTMLMCSLTISLTAYSFEVAADSRALFLCGRVLNGVTLGVSTATVMTYSSEVSPFPFLNC